MLFIVLFVDLFCDFCETDFFLALILESFLEDLCEFFFVLMVLSKLFEGLWGNKRIHFCELHQVVNEIFYAEILG